MGTALPGKRVTRLAKVILDVGWWLVIAGGVLALTLTLLWPMITEGGRYWGTAVQVWIPDEASRRLLPLASPDTLIAREPVLKDVEASLRLEVFGFGPMLLEWIVAVPFLAALILGLRLARSFLEDVLSTQVFSTVNARRLSQLGWLLIAAGLTLPILDFLHTTFLLRRAGLEGVPFSVGIASVGTVLPGILVLVVAAAWRYGVELQHDRDLVV
ncbi:MAG: DUF2975 domain-containing protein [Longimicrobiales bacterium]